MGKPAATLGSLMGHGGTIVAGAPTVLIGKKPAARLGDAHLCPMVTGMTPHLGGVLSSGSSTVLVCGQPAARLGDQGVCTGPPNRVAAGDATVLIG